MAKESTVGPSAGSGGSEVSLKEQGNEFFKAGNYLKAAALYTQAIKLDPQNATLYSNRAAAFLNLVKLNRALADAETTILLRPEWDKGHFRKGCILEAMERYEDAISAFNVALQHNPQSSEVLKKIKKLTQLANDRKRILEIESMRANVDMSKHLSPLKPELSVDFGGEESQRAFDFITDVMEKSIKTWHETGKVDPRVFYLLDSTRTDTEKYAPVVNIDKAFESPDTHKECFSYLRKYAEESLSSASCLVVPKNIISYPQVWKGQGSRKWKHGNSDGFFIQFDSPGLRKLWFVPSSIEKGCTLCREPQELDVTVHEILPRLFKKHSLPST